MTENDPDAQRNNFTKSALMVLTMSSPYPNGWVPLRELRKALYDRGTRRPAQDAYLTRMADAMLIELKNNPGFTSPEDIESALTFHGQECTMVRWIG